MTEINDKEFLQGFCHLCLSGKIFEARCAIVDASQLSSEELENISDEGMEDYVLENIKHPTIHKMVEIEKTLKGAFDVVDVNNPTDSGDALHAVKKINQILPYMSEKDKVFAKYMQCRCYRYIDSKDDSEHFKLLKEVVEGYPYYQETEYAEKFNKFLVNEINDLSVPVADKYEVIKLAQTNSPAHIRHHYNAILSPLANRYFSRKLEEAKEPTISYQAKVEHYDAAWRSIDDVDIVPDIRRKYENEPQKITEIRDHRRYKSRLLVLNLLGKLHKENNNHSGAQAASKEKKILSADFYRKYPRLQKRKLHSYDM